ncbi:hypothetical protein DFH07DRAFT_764450 [Mycena maculata]|uniref:Uncharacterized protein n=1 Tax=Mycena maculata TaxID=230809 RepID=A0AAD7NZS9_9AGAR|nr:hypothetical protein DFH07DRAFT_764450 [Mycena maculata]
MPEGSGGEESGSVNDHAIESFKTGYAAKHTNRSWEKHCAGCAEWEQNTVAELDTDVNAFFDSIPPPSYLDQSSTTGTLILSSGASTMFDSISRDTPKDLAHVEAALRVLKFAESRCCRAGRMGEMIRELMSSDGISSLSDDSYSTYGGELGTSEPKNAPPTGAAFYQEPGGSSFEPGTSIKQLLTNATNNLDPAWNPSSGEILDNGNMSVWMNAPTDFMNIQQWDAYIRDGQSKIWEAVLRCFTRWFWRRFS